MCTQRQSHSHRQCVQAKLEGTEGRATRMEHRQGSLMVTLQASMLLMQGQLKGSLSIWGETQELICLNFPWQFQRVDKTENPCFRRTALRDALSSVALALTGVQ